MSLTDYIDLSDAVVTSLGTITSLAGATIERKYLPWQRLEDYPEGNIVVSVLPAAISDETISRATTQSEIEINVAVESKLADIEPATIDEMLAIVGDVREHFRTNTITNYKWVRTQIPTPFNQDRLAEGRLFTAVITLTFQYHY